MNNISIMIMSFIVVFSLLDIGIEYLHIKKFADPVPEDMQKMYSKMIYQRYIKKETQTFICSTIKSIGRIILFVGFIGFDLFLAFDRFLSQNIDSLNIRYLLFIGGFFFVVFCYDIWVDYIEEFLMKKKKKSKKNIKRFLFSFLKKFGLMFGIGGMMIYTIMAFYDLFGVVFFIIMLFFIESIVVLLSLFFTKILVLFFYHLKPLDEGELKEQIQIFLRQEGYQIEDVYILNQGQRASDMNAFVSGFSTRKRIVLFDGLVKKLTNDEIIAVIAHELGHQKYGHIVYNIALSFILVSGFVFGLWLFMSQAVFSTSFGFDIHHIGFSMLLYIFILDVYVVLARFGLATNSRRFEYQADRYASKVWYKVSLKNALIKITKRNIEHLTPHPIYAMIYFTHPSLVERLKELEEEANHE